MLSEPLIVRIDTIDGNSPVLELGGGLTTRHAPVIMQIVILYILLQLLLQYLPYYMFMFFERDF